MGGKKLVSKVRGKFVFYYLNNGSLESVAVGVELLLLDKQLDYNEAC